MRAREVRERLKGKVDPQVSFCIEALAERQSVISEEMLVMAQHIDQMANLLSNFVQVAENMQNVAEKLQKTRGDEHGVTVISEPS